MKRTTILNESLKQKAEILEKIVKDNIINLHNLWKEIDDVYPYNYQDYNQKSVLLIRSLPLLESCRVLEIGCNSGLYTCLLGIFATCVFGVDISQGLIKRAIKTRDYFNKFIHKIDNVQFLEGNFIFFLDKIDINATVMSLVLYHLNDEEIDVLAEYIRNKVEKVLIQTRPSRDVIYKVNPKLGYISRTSRYNGLYRIEDIICFLKDIGFNNFLILHANDPKFYNETFPIIFAEK